MDVNHEEIRAGRHRYIQSRSLQPCSSPPLPPTPSWKARNFIFLFTKNIFCWNTIKMTKWHCEKKILKKKKNSKIHQMKKEWKKKKEKKKKVQGWRKTKQQWQYEWWQGKHLWNNSHAPRGLDNWGGWQQKWLGWLEWWGTPWQSHPWRRHHWKPTRKIPGWGSG